MCSEDVPEGDMLKEAILAKLKRDVGFVKSLSENAEKKSSNRSLSNRNSLFDLEHSYVTDFSNKTSPIL